MDFIALGSVNRLREFAVLSVLASHPSVLQKFVNTAGKDGLAKAFLSLSSLIFFFFSSKRAITIRMPSPKSSVREKEKTFIFYSFAMAGYCLYLWPF